MYASVILFDNVGAIKVRYSAKYCSFALWSMPSSTREGDGIDQSHHCDRMQLCVMDVLRLLTYILGPMDCFFLLGMTRTVSLTFSGAAVLNLWSEVVRSHLVVCKQFLTSDFF